MGGSLVPDFSGSGEGVIVGILLSRKLSRPSALESPVEARFVPPKHYLWRIFVTIADGSLDVGH